MPALTLATVQCRACGGAVAFPAGEPSPRCLFCDAPDPLPVAPTEAVEPPAGFLPFRVDDRHARTAFQRFVGGSIWRPGALRRAPLVLRPLLLPAWSWSARLDTHWIAVVPAETTVGRPVTGVSGFVAHGVLLPASPTLTRRELAGVCPYAPDTLRPPEAVDVPFEVGTLTRSAATRAAHDGVARMHEDELVTTLGARVIRTSALFHALTGGPLWLPVYLGAYRYRGRLYRVVINGQTGKVIGDAPWSWLRIGAALALAGFVATAAVAVLGIALLLHGRGVRIQLPW